MADIQLTEYQTKHLDRGEIDDAIARTLWQSYGKEIDIEAPSFRNEQRWGLRAKGVIGAIPVAPDLTIRIQPKTAIANIWHMLDTIGDFQSLRIFDRLTDSDSLEDLSDRLAQRLACHILDRVRHGLVARYQPHRDRLSSPRGRIDWPRTARSPWKTRLPCRYTARTADIPDNQILLWTLHHLRRTGNLFRDTTQTQLARAHRALRGSISLVPFAAADCRDRAYDRLNADYREPHALCRFFLEHLSPGQNSGDRHALPFLINTAQLYEKFVAAWLARHLPPQYRLKAQDPYRLGRHHRYSIDLTIYDRATNRAIAVLDTKYKTPKRSSNDDINQILAYAHVKRADRAVLVYPEPLPAPLDTNIDAIRLRSLTFGLDRDTAGTDILEWLAREPIAIDAAT